MRYSRIPRCGRDSRSLGNARFQATSTRMKPGVPGKRVFIWQKGIQKKKERKVYDRNVIYVVSYDFTILVGGCYKLVFTVLFCPLRKPSTEMPTKSGASSWSNCKARAWQQVTAPDHLNFNPSLLVYIDTYHYSDTVLIYDNANNDSI